MHSSRTNPHFRTLDAASNIRRIVPATSLAMETAAAELVPSASSPSAVAVVQVQLDRIGKSADCSMRDRSGRTRNDAEIKESLAVAKRLGPAV